MATDNGRTHTTKGPIARPTMKQRIQIIDMLRAWKDQILKERPHPNTVAEQMQKELGFPITGQVIRAVRKMIDMDWKCKPVGAGLHSKLGIHRRTKALELQVEALRQALFDVCERLGVSPPPMIGNGEWPGPATVEVGSVPRVSP